MTSRLTPLVFGSVACAAALCAAPAQTHPHVFVDTALTLTVDGDNQLTGVEVGWVYDDFYSLLVLQDMGLDEDADGELTLAELSQLQGWDMKWIEGYQGDLYITDAAGKPVALSGPTPVVTKVVNGRIITVHRRQLETPIAAQGATLRAYDPEFYTAYDLKGGVSFAGDTSCEAQVTLPDQDKAYAEAKDVMAAFPEDAVDVPMLGHLFAETVTVTCDPDD